MKIKDQVVVVSGGASGLREATARQLLLIYLPWLMKTASWVSPLMRLLKAL